jgi:hypothetical protein
MDSFLVNNACFSHEAVKERIRCSVDLILGEVREGVLKWIRILLPSQSVTDKIFARFKLYRKLRGGTWQKVSDRVAPKKSVWVRKAVNAEDYYVWKTEVHE